jgi:hypothetical protein
VDAENRIWNSLGVLIAIVTMAVPTWLGYEQFKQGGAPAKSVAMDLIGPIDPLRDLSPLAQGTTLELSLGAERYSSLVIEQFTLTNEGQTPILAGDFFQPLRVTAKPPWEIVAIRDRGLLLDEVQLEWTKLSTSQFEAKPLLLNPGDRIYQTVYLTKQPGAIAGRDQNPPKFGEERHHIELSARIVGLRGFAQERTLLDEIEGRSTAMVYLPLGSVVFLVIVASLFFYWYAWSLGRSGRMTLLSRTGLLVLVLCAALSYATAEVVTYYLFGGDEMTELMFGRNLLNWRYQWHNWTILLVHVGLSLFLYSKVKGRRRSNGSF